MQVHYATAECNRVLLVSVACLTKTRAGPHFAACLVANYYRERICANFLQNTLPELRCGINLLTHDRVT